MTDARKTIDYLRGMGIHNTYELLRAFANPKRDIAISRGELRQHQVHSPTHETDPKAAWYNHGRKTFYGVGDKNPLLTAKQWVEQRYGIGPTEWAVDPTDRATIVPKEVSARALAKVKAAKKAEASR